MSELRDAPLRRYMAVLMGGLLAQGLGSLAFRLVPALPHSTPLVIRGAFGIDIWHAWFHIVWGLAGIALLGVPRARVAVAPFAIVFGTLYTALGLLGTLVYHPLGLELDGIENAFHLTAGPLTLALGIVFARQRSHKRAGAALP